MKANQACRPHCAASGAKLVATSAATSGRALAKRGLCELCEQPLHHGPYTDAQIEAICKDLGSDPEGFGDFCDWCFDTEVICGNAGLAAAFKRRQASPSSLFHPAQSGGSFLSQESS